MSSESDQGEDAEYQELEDVIRASWQAGAAIDLTGVTYGPPHWAGPVPVAPYSYYRFLAGFVRRQRATRVLEVGAHFGGSTRALRRGFADGHGRVVSIDATHDNLDALLKEGQIDCVRGDGAHPRIITAAVNAFRSLPIDILFVDVDHQFGMTIQMLSIYTTLLRPQYVLLDDIGLNDSMRDLWRILQACHPGEALNAVDVEPAIGADVPTPGQGLGVIRLR